MNLSTNSPGPYDVLCCKSSEAYEHIGNRRFRALVQSHSSTYARVTQSKVLKSQVVNDIIRSIRSAGGNFLQQMKGCQGTWTVIKKNRTREKVGHALRRAVAESKKTTKPTQNCSQFVQKCMTSRQDPFDGLLALNFHHNFEQPDFIPSSDRSSIYEPISIAKSFPSRESQDSQERNAAPILLVNESLLEPLGIESTCDDEMASLFASWIDNYARP
mmetsp:Transcript_16172/g.24724  ORF Transcript_16172/g.24724 Transcript_16172/m.24724 type:complete len:216 (+) Transcript_16172:173-820(+)